MATYARDLRPRPKPRPKPRELTDSEIREIKKRVLDPGHSPSRAGLYRMLRALLGHLHTRETDAVLHGCVVACEATFPEMNRSLFGYPNLPTDSDRQRPEYSFTVARAVFKRGDPEGAFGDSIRGKCLDMIFRPGPKGEG